MKEKKYPQKSDIELHKRSLFTALIQYYIGVNDWMHVKQCFRTLMADAALWAKNHHNRRIDLKTGKETPVDIEKVKQDIANLQMEFVRYAGGEK